MRNISNCVSNYTFNYCYTGIIVEYVFGAFGQVFTTILRRFANT